MPISEIKPIGGADVSMSMFAEDGHRHASCIILDIPTVGCAKSVLIGEYEEPADDPDAFSYMHDKKTIRQIVQTPMPIMAEKGVKPIFISPGHPTTLEP